MLLKIGNTVINSDQITEVEYTPFANTTDDDTGQPVVLDAKLEITLASVTAHSFEGFNGHFLGAASESKTIKVYGADADSAWEYFQSIAFPLF